MSPTRREFVAGTVALGLTPAIAAAAGGDTVTPEMFGAKGDGRTNDTQAFARMSAHVNERGGGTIVLRRVTYLVGEQNPSAGGPKASFAPVDVINLKNCTRPITIRGNGAILRVATGLRYGRFDALSGAAFPDSPKLDRTNLAVPYRALIDVQGCSGTVEISDLELDGNLQRMRIGGKSYKGGWDAGGFGIRLAGNSGSEVVSRVRSHHHPADGIVIKPADGRVGSTTITDLISEYNGRQGCSLTGGSNCRFQRCKFNHTGKAGLHHAPGNGVDIEPEGQSISNIAFSNCEFANNAGVGIGEVGRNVSDIRFTGCKVVGTTNWGAWLPARATRFATCLFVGTIVQVHGDANPALATQFNDCTFSDDPALSPTREVYLGASSRQRGSNAPKNIVVLGQAPNILFSGCHFRLVDDGLLPQSSKSVIYADCDMSQRAPQPSGPRGTYIGTNTISGNAHLDGSIIRGQVTLNGRVLPVGG